MNKKWLISITLAAVAVGGGVYAWKNKPLLADLSTVSRGPAIDAVYAAGSIEPSVTQPIASKVMGRLTEVLVEEGATVKKGQVLARMEAGDLQSAVDEAQARLRLAQAQYQRAQELVRQQFVAPVELDRTRADLEAAQAAVRRTQTLRDVLTLVAPADGVILKRDAEVGQVVTAGQAFMTMSCCAPLRATVDVDEEDIARVFKGQKVALRADAQPGKILSGTVKDITPKGDPISRSYRVRIQLASTEGLMPGMTVEANLIVTERPNTLLVPSTAVVPDGKGHKVWLVEQERARAQTVQIGIAGSSKTEILSGLKDGLTVLATPTPEVGEGRRIQAKQP